LIIVNNLRTHFLLLNFNLIICVSSGLFASGKIFFYIFKIDRVDILAEKICKALENYSEIKDEYIEKYKLGNVGKKYLEFLH